MAARKSPRIRKFYLFVDTSVIKTPDNKIELLPTTFLERWNKICRPGDVKLAIPEMVFSELIYQKQSHFADSYKHACTQIKAIKSELPIKLAIPKKQKHNFFRTKVAELLERKLKATRHCEKIPTPYTAISLEHLTDQAIWQLPPFKKDGVGFKDAIILETIRYFHKSIIHSDIAFLCKDERLVQAAQTVFRSHDNFGVFRELEDFENFLHAARKKFTPKFLHKAISQASTIFYNTEANTGLFVEDNLQQKLIEKHSLVVGKIGIDHSKKEGEKSTFAGLLGGSYYECVSDPQFFAANTQFLTVVGANKFHWASEVVISAKYKKPTTLIGNTEEVFKERILVIKIEWESVVTSEIKFKDKKILDIKLRLDAYEDIDDEGLLAQAFAQYLASK